MEYQSLSELQIMNKNDWKIKIRLVRKWKETGRDNSRVQGLHLIVIDSQHNRMHAWIPSALLDTLEDQFVAGQMYDIRNFTVVPFVQKYKCINAESQIRLNRFTVVTPLPEHYFLIPENIYQFTNIKHVQETTEEEHHLIDVVGIVDDIRPMKHVTNTRIGNQFYREFVITDLIDNLQVVFWNELATAFETAFHQAHDQPVVIIISSCRIMRNDHNGVAALTNMPATTFDVNSNCHRVDTLRQRFWEIHQI